MRASCGKLVTFYQRQSINHSPLAVGYGSQRPREPQLSFEFSLMELPVGSARSTSQREEDSSSCLPASTIAAYAASVQPWRPNVPGGGPNAGGVTRKSPLTFRDHRPSQIRRTSRFETRIMIAVERAPGDWDEPGVLFSQHR